MTKVSALHKQLSDAPLNTPAAEHQAANHLQQHLEKDSRRAEISGRSAEAITKREVEYRQASPPEIPRKPRELRKSGVEGCAVGTERVGDVEEDEGVAGAGHWEGTVDEGVASAGHWESTEQGVDGKREEELRGELHGDGCHSDISELEELVPDLEPEVQPEAEQTAAAKETEDASKAATEAAKAAEEAAGTVKAPAHEAAEKVAEDELAEDRDELAEGAAAEGGSQVFYGSIEDGHEDGQEAGDEEDDYREDTFEPDVLPVAELQPAIKAGWGIRVDHRAVEVGEELEEDSRDSLLGTSCDKDEFYFEGAMEETIPEPIDELLSGDS